MGKYLEPSWRDVDPLTKSFEQYIHGSAETSHYLALDPSYKNPADTAETHGIKVS